jgi:hypothetical protein
MTLDSGMEWNEIYDLSYTKQIYGQVTFILVTFLTH